MEHMFTWDTKLDTESSNEFLSMLAKGHINNIQNSDVRESLRRLVSDGDFAGLCDYDLDVSGLSVLDYYNAAQVLAFFRKRDDLDLGIDRKAVAYEKFVATETKCAETNAKLLRWLDGETKLSPLTESAITRASWIIANALGPCPTLEELHLRFGPGATTQIKKMRACAKVKLSAVPACSEDLIPILSQVLDEMPRIRDYALRKQGQHVDFRYESSEEGPYLLNCEVHEGLLGFVPKNAKTERAIVVEPWLNSMVQLGIGGILDSVLKRSGIDIHDQTRNQRLAREGSITGALATLDLTSASDLIAWVLVMILLPLDWFCLLSMARTGKFSYKGRTFVSEKFSSMGNGFTFPLETLIFWALTRAVCGSTATVSAYGDDIICPSDRAEDVIAVLTEVGFSVNLEKSFWNGPFRESCGSDWLSGIDVRPLFIKGAISGHDVMRLHNFYVRSGQYDMAEAVLCFVPDHLFLLGPDGYGDGHLITAPGYVLDEWPRVRKSHHLRKGYDGCVFDTWVYNKRSLETKTSGDRILPFYTIYLREELTDVERRDEDHDAKVRAWLINQDPDNCPSFFETLGTRFVDGVPANYLPGTDGCKRISIYTLAR